MSDENYNVTKIFVELNQVVYTNPLKTSIVLVISNKPQLMFSDYPQHSHLELEYYLESIKKYKLK